MAGFTPSEKQKLLARVATLEAQMSGVAEFIEMMKAGMRSQKAKPERPKEAAASESKPDAPQEPKAKANAKPEKASKG